MRQVGNCTPAASDRDPVGEPEDRLAQTFLNPRSIDTRCASTKPRGGNPPGVQSDFLADLRVGERREDSRAAAFLVIGVLKGRVLGQGMLRSGAETLAVGGGAAVLAYLVGMLIRQAAGVSGL